MAVTKTNFLNFVRCPRYVALDRIKKDKLDADISLEQYKEEEQKNELAQIMGSMYDEETGEDLIDVKNEHLEIMMPYYSKVEMLAGQYIDRTFPGETKFSRDTLNQESFDFVENGIRYLCYVDIFNERKDGFDVIEVKATTSKKFLGMGKSTTNEWGKKETLSIFDRDEDGIFRLREEINKPYNDALSEKDYLKHKANLFNKFHPAGHYIYDIAIQRYIIENDLEQNNIKKGNNKFYLAVMNHEYVFDGKYNEANEPIYAPDENGNELIVLFDVTQITTDYLGKIDLDRQKIERYINQMDASYYKIGEQCELKKTTKCKYCPICFSKLPKKNSIMNYLGSHNGFKDELGNKYNRYDLIDEGMLHMLDVPANYLNRRNNQIQREVVETDNTFINEAKIRAGIKCIKYPIYHLDFETFPCPLPRYKGEKPYYQSVFQFSLHIENEPYKCDKEKNHYEFLARDHMDYREELIKKMIEHIDINSGGTILVYNQSFEKTRLRELAEIFPQYKKELDKMNEMVFDLLFLVSTNSKLYEDLGFDADDAKLFNYYHKNLYGSFSIKKVLPLFTNLTYEGMEVGNGMQALVAYASFPKLNKKVYEDKYKALVKYCQQDTWAMVEVLWGLKKLVEVKETV